MIAGRYRKRLRPSIAAKVTAPLLGVKTATVVMQMTDHATSNVEVAAAMRDVEIRRRRAAYRASHRGTKEMDHLMGRFAEARLAAYESDALARFERLLALPDPTLQVWIFSGRGFDGIEFSDLIHDIRAFHGLSQPGSSPT